MRVDEAVEAASCQLEATPCALVRMEWDGLGAECCTTGRILGDYMLSLVAEPQSLRCPDFCSLCLRNPVSLWALFPFNTKISAMWVVILTDCGKSGLLFYPLSKHIWECKGIVYRLDNSHMVFTCQFHQPCVSYLLPQCCFALTMGTSISINFPKGQLRSRFGNKCSKVQCRKYHWILNNSLVSATRSFPWFQFALVYPGHLTSLYKGILVSSTLPWRQAPSFPLGSARGKEVLTSLSSRYQHLWVLFFPRICGNGNVHFL